MFSNDPRFVDQLRDVARLCINPLAIPNLADLIRRQPSNRITATIPEMTWAGKL
jgi:hypothetical protein